MIEDKIIDDEKPKQIGRGPILTWLACAICVFIFLGLSSKGNLDSWESASKWGYFPSGAVWDGKYWGLITSVFVHLELWHLAFNVYWLWHLGRLLESALGTLRWVAFFLFAALISSASQLAMSGDTGIGASGVVYAIFGFIWAARKYVDKFQSALSKQTIVLFIVWLFICLVTTYFNVWVVGNAAHFSGILFGILVADIFVVKYKPRIAAVGLTVLMICSIVPIFWAPWSSVWVGKQAYKAHLREDYATAINLYRRSLDLGADPIWVWSNLALLYKTTGDTAKHEEAFQNLRKLDEKAAQSVK
jgi:rhomboid protease GluP